MLKPLELVKKWPGKFPGIYEKLDTLAEKKEELDWPDYCPLPMSGALNLLAGLKEPENEVDWLYTVALASELTACWAWRQNKVIFRFDADLAKTLAEQSLEDDEKLPVELLMHAPYPIIYIKASFCPNIDGFFYWLDYDITSKLTEARILWVTSSGETAPEMLLLDPDKSLQECILDTYPGLSFDNDSVLLALKLGLNQALQLILYLSAKNADIEYAYPRKKRSYISDTASEIHQHEVGIRIGITIRKTRKVYIHEEPVTPNHGSLKRPHSRRGHWHHFWTGSRDGDRELILKWVAPIYVHAGSDDIVIHTVK